MVSNFKLDPRNPPKMTPEEMARLDAMTEEEIIAAAESDPDNPPLTDEQIDRFRAARAAKRARLRAGMTQKIFAETYRIGHGRLRDVEGARNKREDSVLTAYLALIEHDPEAVRRVLAGTLAQDKTRVDHVNGGEQIGTGQRIGRPPARRARRQGV